MTYNRLLWLTVLVWLTATATAQAQLPEPALPNPKYPSVPPQVETSGLEYITPTTQRAIDRGLRFLSKKQSADGSYGSGPRYRHNVAVTALSSMAFLSAGHMPSRGPYGEQVDKTVEFLLRHTKPSGFIYVEEGASHGPMYGHGFATLYLAEVYGTTPRKEIREKLSLAVNLIVNSQNDQGGWRYEPNSKDADVSVTVCQIMALRAARNAGIFVPKDTVDRCIKYVKACQNNDGGFRYQLNHNRDSLFPRSAAGVVALYSAGEYEGAEITRGIQYLHRHLPRPGRARNVEYYFYGNYYGVQAMWHAGGDHWKRWYPAVRDDLLIRQSADGSWDNTLQNPEYGTAMALLILQMPNNYLPIFQR
ncbi:Prenyltransferase and squalene oxidase repeat protein [Symmachiella dynata]|uniref:Prenyltransferase and squalene oxidase repeat protein n=1 Tax=Symmachiella dynata TaxID=2527995 RepID=A0A517ZS49_9PLAN|nr:prenyltransferase/squalene oxidase repeat-containing protein [Symmachiella dynata]QDU45274.1 Prenyltransferase and squalene oxidase repeat protein [Symmachiella dynata]